jgi:hypothetical protein
MNVLLTFAILLAPVAVDASEPGPGYVAAGLAQYWLHDSDNGPGGWLAAGYDAGLLSTELGLTLAPSYGTGFASIDAGLSASPYRRGRVRPFVYAGLGIMGEEDFGGFWMGAGVGIELRLSGPGSLRVSAGLAQHGDAGSERFQGPHRLALAWKHAFGRRRH